MKTTSARSADADGAIRGELIDEEGVVELAFPGGGVALEDFINWIQRVLDINIISGEEVRGQEVLLGEPLQFETDQLLDLLSALLARDGLALFKRDIGFYEIMPASNLPPVFRDGELITTRVIPTPLISPSAIQPKIAEALGQSANQVRVSALDDVGVLLVTGTPEMTETVAQLVQKYVDVRGEMQLFTHAFENVSADYGRQRIVALYDRISQSGRAGAGQGQATRGDGLSNLEEKLILDQGNTLIFRGRPDEWRLVKDLAERADVVNDLKPKRYVVGQIAQQVANAAQDLGLGSVRESRSVERLPRRRGRRPTGTTSVARNEDASLASGFVLDVENGAFTYFGTESQHERVKELVKTYREQTESNRVTIETYKLHHVPAEEMADLLNEILQDPATAEPVRRFALPPGLEPQGPAAADPSSRQDRSRADGRRGASGRRAAIGFITATADQVTITFQRVAQPHRRPRHAPQPAGDRADHRAPRPAPAAGAHRGADRLRDRRGRLRPSPTDIQFSDGEFAFLSTFGVTSLSRRSEDPNTISGANVGHGLHQRGLQFGLRAHRDQRAGDDRATPSSSPTRASSSTTTRMPPSSPSVRSPFSSTTQGTATTVTSQGGTATRAPSSMSRPDQRGRVPRPRILHRAVGLRGAGTGRAPAAAADRELRLAIVTIPSDYHHHRGRVRLHADTENESAQIPFIGDIPLDRRLFKSTSGRRRKSGLIFVFITPKILDDPNFQDLRLATEGPSRTWISRASCPICNPRRSPSPRRCRLSSSEIGARVDRSDLLLRTPTGPRWTMETLFGPRRENDQEPPGE